MVEIIAAVRAGVDLLLCSADRAAQRADRVDARAAASRGLFDPDELAASSAAGRRAPGMAGLGRRGAGPVGRRVRGASSPVARARRAVDHAGPGRRRGRWRRALALPPDARILAIMPQPTDLTPADTSSTVRARSGPGAANALRIGRGGRSSGSRRPTPRSPGLRARAADVRRGRRRDDRRDPAPGAGGAGQGGRLRPAGRPWAWPSGRPGTWRSTRRRSPRSAPTRSCPIRSRRWRRRSSASSRSRAGCPCRWPARIRGGTGAAGALRVSLHDEILEQPEVAARFLAAQADPIEADRGVPARAGRCDRSSSPPAGPRTMRPSTPSTCWASGTGCRSRSGRRRSSRSTASCPTSPTRSSSGSASPARRRTSSRSSRPPAPRARRPWRSPTSPARRWQRPRTGRSTSAPARNWRSPRPRPTPTELLAIAMLSAALADDPADRAGRSAAMPGRARSRPRGRARDRADRRRAGGSHPGRWCSPAGTSTRPPASGPSSSRSWPGCFADPYSSADFQHGPMTLVEPGVPVLAVVRAGRARGGPGGPAAAASRGARRRADGRLGSTGRPGAGDLAGGPPRRARRSGWARSCRSFRASSTRLHLTRARGLDPERPRNLRKVTRTT